MLQTLTRRHGACGIDRGTTFLNRNDLSLGVNDKRGPACQVVRAKDAVEFHHITLVIREHRKFGVQLLGPMVESGYEIAADGQYLGVRFLKIANTRLVGGEFAGSTTGKRGGEESQDDILLAPEIRELHRLVGGVGKREIGRDVADFQICVLRLRRLSEKRSRGKRQSDSRKVPHAEPSLAYFDGWNRRWRRRAPEGDGGRRARVLGCGSSIDGGTGTPAGCSRLRRPDRPRTTMACPTRTSASFSAGRGPRPPGIGWSGWRRG